VQGSRRELLPDAARTSGKSVIRAAEEPCLARCVGQERSKEGVLSTFLSLFSPFRTPVVRSEESTAGQRMADYAVVIDFRENARVPGP